MTRLIKATREILIAEMLTRRFKDEAQALQNEYYTFVDVVYGTMFTPKVLAKMKRLPKGWLPTKSNLRVYGHESDHSTLYINSEYSLSLREVGVKLDTKRPYERLFPYNWMRDTYPLPKELDLDLYNLQRKRSKFRELVKTTKADMNTLVKSTTTVKGLIRIWPEIEPFVKKYDVKAARLPVPAVAGLNTVLGLP